MINYEAITSFGTMFISLVGFGFIIYQIRQVNKSIRNSTMNTIHSRAFENMKILFENPEIRPYFYEGKKYKKNDKVDYQKILIFAEFVADYFQQILLQSDTMNKESQKKWNFFIQDIICNSPELQKHLFKNKEWYTKEIIECIKNNL